MVHARISESSCKVVSDSAPACSTCEDRAVIIEQCPIINTAVLFLENEKNNGTRCKAVLCDNVGYSSEDRLVCIYDAKRKATTEGP